VIIKFEKSGLYDNVEKVPADFTRTILPGKQRILRPE
jgi:hypothetical protein